MTDKNMLELEESIPSLTLTPELDAQAEAAEEAAPEVEPVFLDESAYTEAERKVIADFSEKIDIINWSENPAILIENALSPAKVVSVIADDEEKTAKVVVPDYQLSLAIGKEGQNARLAARLTGFKIDIKSETQAKQSEDFNVI